MRAIVYIRVSTDDQAASGAGLDAQRDACRSHADRHGWELGGTFADEGVGGATPLDKRPGLMGAIEALGRGDCLLVAKRDRVGRQLIVVAMIEAAVERRGARVVSTAGEGTGGDEAGDVLMRNLIDSFAAYERLVIKGRTRAALAAKRRRGERTGGVPFGSTLVDDGRRSKAGLPVALVADPGELAAVGLMRAWRSEGRSLRWIAGELTRRGVPTKLGGMAWPFSTVGKLLAASPDPTPSAPPDLAAAAGAEAA